MGRKLGNTTFAVPLLHGKRPGKLGYLYAEQERSHRVYLCENCRRFPKVVLVGGEEEEEVVLPLDDLATIALDQAAKERGLPAGMQNCLLLKGLGQSFNRNCDGLLNKKIMNGVAQLSSFILIARGLTADFVGPLSRHGFNVL